MRLCLAASALLIGGSSVVSRAQTIDFPPPLEVRVPKPPTVAHGAGQAILPYELHVTNLAAQPVTLQRVDVLNADDGSVVQTTSWCAFHKKQRTEGR